MVSCKGSTFKAQKSRSSLLKHDDQVNNLYNATISRVRTTAPRPRSRKLIICRQTHQNQAELAQIIPKEQLKRIARVMRELNLPYSASKPRPDTDPEGLPRFLRWSVSENPRRGYLRYRSDLGEPLRTRASFQPPLWSQAPSCVSHLGIRKSISRFERSCSRDFGIDIPSNWPVFDGVVWSHLKFLRGSGITDSSDIGRPTPHPARAEEPRFAADSDFELGVNCHPERVAPARLRSFWTLFSTLVPDRFHWCIQPEERALRRDARRHVGFLDLNQPSANRDMWPQTSIEALLGFWESSQLSESEFISSTEMDCPSKFGRLLTNVVATDMFPAQSRCTLRWPVALNQAGTPPIIDYTCRVRQDVMGWRDDMCPLLFAAQHGNGDEPSAIKQLAKAFQPMMTLFILYFLDFRTSRSQQLPSWMVLYGVVYDEHGLRIRAHYPCFDPPQKGSNPFPVPGWGSVSYSAGSKYTGIVHAEPNDRAGVIGALNRIQGHCVYVMRMLQTWDGYEAAISRLLL